jgi:hypothetical protein
MGLAMTIAGFAFILQGRAGADSVPYYFSNAETAITGFPLSFQIPLFAPSMGTLQSVEISYSSGVTATTTVTNTNRSVFGTTTGSVDAVVTLGLTDSMGLIPSLQGQVTTTTQDFMLSTKPPQATLSWPTGDTIMSSSTYNSAAILSGYTGIGTISLSVAASMVAPLSISTGSATDTFSGTATIDGSVTYVFAPASVPEPSSLVLGAVGTLAILGCGLRRRFGPAAA